MKTHLWITDYDGTIKPSNGEVSPIDLETLQKLGKKGDLRVVATGRSLFAFLRDKPLNLELDYLIYSSGLGLCDWTPSGPGHLMIGQGFSHRESQLALSAALALNRGFFAYAPPPDSHKFLYYPPDSPPAGFTKRLEIYQNVATPWVTSMEEKPLGQLLIMVPTQDMKEFQKTFEKLAPGLSYILSTSPFEDNCLWLEVYPPGVSKGLSAASLAFRLNLTPDDAIALGNDFNDLDLLAWAKEAFVTSEAPPELCNLYQVIPKDKPPLAWAVNHLGGHR